MRTGRFGRAGCAKKQHETLKKSIPRGQIAFAVGQRSFWCLSLEAILPPPQEPHDVLGGGRAAAKGLIIMPEIELEGGSSLRRARLAESSRLVADPPSGRSFASLMMSKEFPVMSHREFGPNCLIWRAHLGASADRFPVNREISLQIPANQGNHLPWQNKQPFCG